MMRDRVLGIVLAVGALGFGVFTLMVGMVAAADASQDLAVSRTSLARLSDHEPLTYLVIDGARLEPTIQLTRDYGPCRTRPGQCWDQVVAVVPIGWGPSQEVPAWLKCFRGCLGQTWSAGALAGTFPITRSFGERHEWPAADEGLVQAAERTTRAKSAPRVWLLEYSEPVKRSGRMYVLVALFAVLTLVHGAGSVVFFRRAVR